MDAAGAELLANACSVPAWLHRARGPGCIRDRGGSSSREKLQSSCARAKAAVVFKEQMAERGGSGSSDMTFLVIKTKKGKLKADRWKQMKHNAS